MQLNYPGTPPFRCNLSSKQRLCFRVGTLRLNSFAQPSEGREGTVSPVCDPAVESLGQRPKISLIGNPAQESLAKSEPAGKDSHYGEQPFVESNRTPQNVCIRREILFPEPVAQQYGRP